MYYKISKRIIDIIIASISLSVLSLLLIPVMILLKVTGEHEIFYLQYRIGYQKNIFKIYKFATMLKDSEKIGTGSITIQNDPRVTKVGSFLRFTKINEFPQILNVLIGNMSIVGPRPLMVVDFQKYSKEIQNNIYEVKPGITGIGSIIFRDEQELIMSNKQDPTEYYTVNIMPYKGALELWYQEHASLYTDFMIIFLTAWVILFPKSQLAFRLFKDLPRRPQSLQPKSGSFEEGIKAEVKESILSSND